MDGFNLNPMYFFHKETMPEFVRKENELTSFEVCMSVANMIDESVIEGAQKVGDLWKIYIDDPEARAMFLSTGLRIRHRFAQIEKVTIQDLPLAIDNQEVYNLINSYPGCIIISDVKNSKKKILLVDGQILRMGTAFVT